MKLLQTLGMSAALLGYASMVEAQGIEGLTMTSDPEDIVFTVRADEPLHTPSVQTYEGSVRVRFREMDTPQAIQVRGDGAAIKLADVRGGSHDSSVLRLDLGDATKLAIEDVRVEKRGHSVVVRIARDLLPPTAEPRTQDGKAAAPVAVAAAPVAAPAAPVAKPAAAPAKAEALAKAEAPAAAPAAKPAAPAPLAKAQAKDVPLAKAMANNGSSSPMPMLLAISAILAVAYAALRLVMKKQKSAQGPRATAPIDIVAQKRIGPRHQLVIVRAFGREHLLSIQGGTTTPIATSDELFEETAPVMEPSGLMADAPAAEPAHEQPRVEKKKEEEAVFGGELLRAALAQRLKEATAPRTREPAGRPTREDKTLSQAVAGLVRLRRDADLQ
jgi:flagellar biogenesis protein FliO